MARFSKTAMVDYLFAQMECLEARHGFKFGEGWAVVEGCDIRQILDFGRYQELRDLVEAIGDGEIKTTHAEAAE